MEKLCHPNRDAKISFIAFALISDISVKGAWEKSNGATNHYALQTSTSILHNGNKFSKMVPSNLRKYCLISYGILY